MDRRNRRFPSLFDIDDLFGLDIQRIMNEMNAAMKDLQENPESNSDRPLYYGYSVKIGPDGDPKIKEWGNVRRSEEQIKPQGCSCPPDASNQDETVKACSETIVDKDGEDDKGPYTCSMFDEKKNELKIHADIPGISKEDIDLELKDNKLILDARNETRYYHKEIPIDHELSSDDIKANYNNGLLEITLNCKKQKSSKKAEKIKIE